MNPQLQSDKISLIPEYSQPFGKHYDLDRLWQTLRRTAVEPGQASFPDFASFADECLFCAQITPKVPEDILPEGNRQSSDPLWDPRASELACASPSQQSCSQFVPPANRRVGLIYLHAGPANLPAGEANIGVIIHQGMQCRGYAREAVRLVLRWAFEELKFHRVQAAILDTHFKDRALRLFIGSGFVHEGTKRRAVYQPEGEGMAGVWKDVTYLAMLDTEWVLRSTWCQANQVQERPVATIWDEMFARHSREQEELVRWEEAHGRMKRSSSMETLREHIGNAGPDLAYLTDDASSVSGDPSVRGSPPSGHSSPPSPHVFAWDSEMEDGLDLDDLQQRWALVDGAPAPQRQRQSAEDFLPEPSPPRHLLALPSIPSRLSLSLSNEDPRSPLTIPSPSARSNSSSPSPFSSPTSSPYRWPPPSPSPAPSSSSNHSHTAWTDSEDEDRWLNARALIPPTTPHDASTLTHPPAGPSGAPWRRSRSGSASSASTDSWSDAQSNWDNLSDISDHDVPHVGA